MLAVCAGVFAAHEEGVIHRDLKPQNIFLARTALGDVVPKVLDFGISKLLDEQADSALTNSGSVMGTTHYLSPEQVTGQAHRRAQRRVRAGRDPVRVRDRPAAARGRDDLRHHARHQRGPLHRARSPLRPDLPPRVRGGDPRAMANRPDGRFATVHALGRALLPFASPKGRVMWSEYFERGQRAARLGGRTRRRASRRPPGRRPWRCPG